MQKYISVEQKRMRHGSPALSQLKKWQEHSKEVDDPFPAVFQPVENGSVWDALCQAEGRLW